MSCPAMTAADKMADSDADQGAGNDVRGPVLIAVNPRHGSHRRDAVEGDRRVPVVDARCQRRRERECRRRMA